MAKAYVIMKQRIRKQRQTETRSYPERPHEVVLGTRRDANKRVMVLNSMSKVNLYWLSLVPVFSPTEVDK